MPVSYKWKIPNIPLLNGKSMPIFNELSDTLIKNALNVYQSNIVLESPVGATGGLRKSITQYQESYTRGSIFVKSKYGIVVEEGRRPAPVSKQADRSLSAWIRRSRAGQAYFSGLRSTYPKITESQAIFLLKRSKKKKPTPPNPYFKRGFDKSQPMINNMWGIYQNSLARRLFT